MKFLEFLGKSPPAAAPAPAPAPTSAATASERGHAPEDLALAHLQAAGLQLVAGNYRTPGPGAGGIALVLRGRDRTLVFVEVRIRSHGAFGGAGGSIGATKQRRIIFAAQHYLRRLAAPPPSRFALLPVQPQKP